MPPLHLAALQKQPLKELRSEQVHREQKFCFDVSYLILYLNVYKFPKLSAYHSPSAQNFALALSQTHYSRIPLFQLD
jgi:predicted transposase YdaD